jgi:L-lactate dehydrogenase complex protein LldG
VDTLYVDDRSSAGPLHPHDERREGRNPHDDQGGLGQRTPQGAVRKGAQNLLFGPDSEIGKAITQAWPADAPKLVPYDRPAEEMKPIIVNDIDAGITGTMGAIADTGSLIVWPSPAEPRLMSLVPPIHIAVLDASKMFDNLPEAMKALGWPKNAPGNNAVLISGPSKTADIEGILCFGVHGPKQLVILVVKD